MNINIEHKPPLVVIAGPTAVGKTKLSIALAKKIGGEVISADSMQVYKQMNIGSAKIMPEEMDGVPHHLIDVLEPTDEFDVTIFQSLAKEAISEVYNRQHIPILVGGTGFYIQAVLKDIDFTATASDDAVRKKWEDYAASEGAAALHSKLAIVDPEAALQIPEGNVKRVVRALEYFETTGELISIHNAKEADKEYIYNTAYFVLTDERDKLYARINERVDGMMAQGFLQEVSNLKTLGLTSSDVSMQGLGYKQLLKYMEGEYTLPQAIDEVKLQTRHFAKRQLTWFRREKDTIWIHKGEFGYNEAAILEYAVSQLGKKGILDYD